MPTKRTKQLYDLEGNDNPHLAPQIIAVDGSEMAFLPQLASADDPDREGYNPYADNERRAPSIFRP